MNEPVKNSNLSAARKAKNDEFYTGWRDIENETNAYLDFNQDAFRGKTVLLLCDDPEWSNFTKYFALNFESMGIKKLISTSYTPAANPMKTAHEPSDAEKQSPHYDPVKSWENGRIFVLEQGVDLTGDGRVDVNDIVWDYLDGDGDFRSDEVTALRDEADMVVTNPPFSLFREFMAWVVEGGVEFAVIGIMIRHKMKRDVVTYIKGDQNPVCFPVEDAEPGTLRLLDREAKEVDLYNKVPYPLDGPRGEWFIRRGTEEIGYSWYDFWDAGPNGLDSVENTIAYSYVDKNDGQKKRGLLTVSGWVDKKQGA